MVAASPRAPRSASETVIADTPSSRANWRREGRTPAGMDNSSATSFAAAPRHRESNIMAARGGETGVANRDLDGHCDCAFGLNYYRWCWPDLGALIAPRALLIASGAEDTSWRPEG